MTQPSCPTPVGRPCGVPYSRLALGLPGLAALALLPTFSTELRAQAPEAEPMSLSVAATGNVEGRVLNVGTGRYLNNARVSVEGTDITVFTNEYGEYRLQDLQPGEVTLKVFYTGLTPQAFTVKVTSGETLTKDVDLGAPAGDDTITLAAITVNTGRETNMAAIATNEQRFAPNIKTVIETDAFGDVAEGNVGEFLKFLPGVTVDYVAADVRTVSVRGFGAQFSSVYVDGFRMASAASGSSIRAFEFEQVSINNAGRIEVSKVPTPSLPADALGGSVNMISKNAFERKGKQLNYQLYLNANSEDVNPAEKSVGPGNKSTFKVLPGASFDLTIPVNKNLGFVVTGLSSNQFNEQHRTQQLWSYALVNGVNRVSTPDNPFMQQYQMQDGPKNTFRDSMSVKMDWRISPESSMWVGYQSNYYNSFFGNRNLTWDATANAVSATASAAGLSFDSDTTVAAVGRGTIRHGTSFRDKMGAANAVLAKYRFNGHLWDFDAGLGYSSSRSWYRDGREGHFQEVRTTLQGMSRLVMDNINEERPGLIRAESSTGTAIDYNNLGNYRVNTVRIQPLDATDEFKSAHANVKRELDFLKLNGAITLGVDIREQTRDIRRWDQSWTHVGADGVANTADDNASAYLDTSYGPYSYWGLSGVQWVSPYALWDKFQSTPAYFTETTAQQLATARYKIQNSQLITETVSAAFVQGDFKFFKNKLNVITGVRFENTSDDGAGPLSPNTGTTLALVQNTWKERGYKVKKSYDGYYPSLHLNYNVTDSVVARLAYAKSFGRPDFGSFLPLVRVNTNSIAESDGIDNLPARTISANNTGLQPYEADNFDLSLEYYTKNGGMVSVGAFYKEITNFFGTSTKTATAADVDALGLDSSFVGYDLTTTINTDKLAKITGAEFSLRQRLDFIPIVGRKMEFFLNATKIDLDGAAEADFRNFIEESANTGITYRPGRATLRFNVNYRGRQLQAPQTGSTYNATISGKTDENGFYEYYAPRVTVDVNADYKFSQRITVFANVRNLFNQSQDLERYNTVSPDYAKLYRREKFGAQITLGVKGTF